MDSAFFHPNICNLCKTPAWQMPLKRCTKCRISCYCCVEHQKEDWKQHKELCSTFLDAIKDVEVGQDRSRLRGVIILMCEKALGRKLNPHELVMCYLHRRCGVCDEMAELIDCPECFSYTMCYPCSVNHAHPLHNCSALRLNLDTQLYLWHSRGVPMFKIR